MRSESNKYATFRNLLLTGGAMSALSIGLAPSALAQSGSVEKVTVTGTRVPQKNLQTTSPVTQVTGEDVDKQGVTRVEDLTNQLPQVFAAQGSNVSNGASGTAQVNLRGLGAVRNLVLINGRRMPYGSPLSPAADLNQIPAQLVDRVELYTGGASAIYGSDALTGVVNFILRKDFEGVQIDFQYGFYSHSNDFDGPGNIRDAVANRALGNPLQFALPQDDVNDGFSKDATGMIGVNSADGKGNLTAYVAYRSNEKVLQRDRDFSACSLATGTTTSSLQGPGFNTFRCGGSSTAAPARFLGLWGNFTLQEDPLSPDFGTGVPGFFNAATGTDLYNFGPLNYYQRPDERYALGVVGHYQIDEQVEVYTELMFTDYRTDAQIAPSGNFFNTSALNCENPYFNGSAHGAATTQFAFGSGAFSLAELGAAGCTAGVIGTNTTIPMYIGRRNVEGGGRDDNIGLQSYRMVGGIRGNIVPGWDYDFHVQFAKVGLDRVYKNELSVTRIGRSLDIVDADPALGVVDPQCRSFVNGTDPNCVPWNIFELNGVTPEALAYLQVPLVLVGETNMRNAQLIINADLGTLGMKSPFAETPFAAVFGAEFKRDELEFTADVSFETGDGAGQGGPTKSQPKGASDVNEFFVELEAYLIEDAPMAKQVRIDGAYRYSAYDNSVKADTWSLGIDWAPTEDFKFRGSMQHSIRAANVIELFSPQSAGLFDAGFDPCDKTLGTYAGDAACIGVNPWQVTTAQATSGNLSSPAGQYNGLFGGNPNLQPEVGDTETLGVVLTPTFMKNLVVTVDWYHIELTNLISTLAPDGTLNDCYAGDAAACALINRAPGSGSLWLGNQGFVTAINQNIGGLEVQGIDVNASYKFNLDDVDLTGAGSLRFDMIGSHLEEWINGGTNCAGLTGGGACNVVNPKWRHRFRATWATPWDMDLAVTWRHRGSVVDVRVPLAAPDREFDAYNYIDVATSIDLPLNTTLRLGVNNVFDLDPPLSRNTGAGQGNGNTYPQNYDALGRWVFMGITVDM